jgi:DNA-binding beta-propeller fold protein YncE
VTTASGTSATGAGDKFTYIAPVSAGPVNASVAYDSTGTAITLNLSGGTAGSVAVATQAGHGTATASGTSISYKPASGFFGADSFTYTASNSVGTSTAATVSITVSPPVITVSPTTLAAGTVGTAYSQTLSPSGGQAPYSFATKLASGALPAGLSLSTSGAITGTPTAAGAFTFTVNGTDSSTLTHASFTSATLSLTVAPAAGSGPPSGPPSGPGPTNPSPTPAVPSVTALSPATGFVAGGFPVTITGNNFLGATAVMFGATPVSKFNVVSAVTITTTVPLGAPGTVDVTVTTPGGTSAASTKDQFTYLAAPAIASQVYTYDSTLGVTGTPGSDNSHFNRPVAGDVDVAHGHLFVADPGNHRVQVLDTTSLQIVATIGVAGVSGGDAAHLNQPGGVGFDAAAGHIFVADTGNHRIQVFDAQSFRYLSTLGTSGVAGSDNTHFNLPSSARINPTTRQLYVADTGNHRVEIFDAGTFGYLATIGGSASAGSDNLHLNLPRDAEVNLSTGQIMVADTGNGRIQLFDPQSYIYVATIGSSGLSQADNLYLGTPVTVAFDPTTNLVLVADAGIDDRIQVFDGLTYDYAFTLGSTASSGPANSQFAGPAGVAIDPAHAHIFIGDTANDRVQTMSVLPAVTFASILPGSRAVELGRPATLFASVINAGKNTLNNCRVALPITAPPSLTLTYQATDPATNALVGTPDTPTTIAGGNGLRTFLLSFAGTSPLVALNQPLDFECDGVAPAAIGVGVDTVDLVVSSVPVADVIALAATPSGDGILNLPNGGTGAFAVASANVGATASLVVSLDTGGATLPLVATICQTNATTGQCLATAAASITVNDTAGTDPTFSIFAQANGPIVFAPGTSRLFVRFRDASGTLHGSTSVAIQTK